MYLGYIGGGKELQMYAKLKTKQIYLLSYAKELVIFLICGAYKACWIMLVRI